GNFEANGLMIANSRLARHGIAAPHASIEQIKGSGISTRLLQLQISELLTASSVLSSEEAQALLSPTLTLLKAVCSLARKASQPVENLALARFKAFIKENLSDADLSIEMISDRLGMSRATLYRVAEPLGGVRKYIRTQRLKLAHAKLLAGEESARSITNLAFDLGFGTETAFRRAFKEAFGMPPSQMNPSTKSAH
ncbi:MAG: helix-turn-helix domain-containing protein, partial [Alphaproteobacteria bacterium]|nr:helix-turn-helix domain-containing protein [Alphaproteobacteria bacterium]